MHSKRRLFSSLIPLVLSISIGVAYLQKQHIYDWWRLRQYDPPSEIASLTTDTMMQPLAEKIFYVAHPKLQERTTFRQSCSLVKEPYVLGCFSNGVDIFLFNVSDARLEGVKQVTAAHEMLHAAYDRLSTKERTRIDTLTAAVLADLKDERIQKNIASYRARDPNVVPNELHSILGTEVRSLPKELETYYKRYFVDRAKIVSFSEKYEAEFTKRSAQVAEYDAQLAALKASIQQLNSSLDAQNKTINAESDRLESLLAQKQYDTYNAGIPNYKSLVNKYNNDISKLKSAIASYNEIVDKRNSIVTEEQELINAIDSSVPRAKE